MKRKIGFIFPGYGSQCVGMGKELYDVSRVVQECFEEASNCLSENFVKLCFASSDAELAKMNSAYPSIFLTSIAISSLLKEKGVKPDVVAGYNLGELSALFAAGGITLPDGLYMLSKCALFYQQELENLDVAVIRVTSMQRNLLEKICAHVSCEVKPVTITSYKTETDHVVAGFTEAVQAVEDRVIKEDGKVKELTVEHGLHSSIMDPIMEQLDVYTAKVDFNNLEVPLISCLSAEPVQTGEDVKNAFISGITHPILWDKVLSQFADCDLLLEIGPGCTMQDTIKACYPDKEIITVQKPSDIDKIISILGLDKPQEQEQEDSKDTEPENTVEDASEEPEISEEIVETNENEDTEL